MEVVTCKQFSGTFTFPGSGAVKRFVITTAVNQVVTANIKLEAVMRLGIMTVESKYPILIHLGENKYLFLKVTRNCR